ncbi:MAG TPA: penicillin-binding transpeptidase domain-containing protein [Solirubrobacteraceae bacterium]|nr:penicillin-binding transpeptidase domain-containing protein [Solirubrobacteraceae bacterium]
MESSGDRRAPITPQLALRVAILGGVAFALFAIVFFRLWYLQVLSGDKFLAQATVNRVREVSIQAPRGKIVDRSGKTIVANKVAVVVELDPAKLPEEERELAAKWAFDVNQRAARPKGQRGDPIPIPRTPTAELRERYQRLGRVLNLPGSEIHRRVVRSLVLVPYSNVRLKTDVPLSTLAFISERPELFSGVTVDQTYVRDYPNDSLAAQILGTIGEISPKEKKDPRFRGVPTGTIIGKDGLERAYDRYLRGVDGKQRIQVDAFGRPAPNPRLKNDEPIAGQRLRLSLDLSLQRTTQTRLAEIGGGRPGAAIALDPRDGAILAMASHPTFDPAVLTKPFTQERYEALTGEDTGKPLFNRAIAGQYPTGSTFKAITALAGLEKGLITPGTTINDTGCITVGEAERCNARDAKYGPVDLARAIQVSSDVYFYTLGMSAFYSPGDDHVIQRYARKLGFGRATGIDLPGEDDGVIPDKQWREDINQIERDCRKEKGISLTVNVFAAGAKGCGISDLREYNLGDTVNLAIGQGDLQATPLQLAVSYAAIANKGKVVVPHLGLEILRANGELVQRIERDPARRVDIDEADRQAVARGLHLAASAPGGTSADVFAGWNHGAYPVHGKTGTAERQPKADQSWYVAYVPDPKRPIVVAVTVEEGGFGAATAAPIACRMLAKFYEQQVGCAAGEDQSQ